MKKMQVFIHFIFLVKSWFGKWALKVTKFKEEFRYSMKKAEIKTGKFQSHVFVQ